eukprot:jgi/Ulvmu1/8775/UM048_0030.1
MHAEVDGFAERIRNGLVFRSDCSARSNRPRTKSIPSDVNDVNMSAMEALERQSDNLIAALKPDDESISLRRSVFLFVEKIITDCFSDVPIKVQLFGSVPIRTYLPHGDIDCTFYIPSDQAQDLPNWANRLMKHIEQHIPSPSSAGGMAHPRGHPRNHPAPNAHFRGALSSASAAAAAATAGAMTPSFAVHSVNVIPAEVTLVKCNIDVPSHSHAATMVVDISFNQRGGVNAASFLEEADRYIDAFQAVRNGDDAGVGGEALLERWDAEAAAGGNGAIGGARQSLLKRCIILVKAWSYYEARVLGAHHSLMSSYGLEVMVLYVLLHYPARASTPFSLLCTYLQVFSGFDWSQHALSLHGPIPLNALGDGGTAEGREPLKPGNGACAQPLIPRAALAKLLGDFAMPPRHRWRPRPMNILDPLQDLNNLGRSVSKASHQRIVLAMRNVTGVIDDMYKAVEANIASAEAEFRGRLFRHRFLHGTFVHHSAMVPGGVPPVAQLPHGATATPGIPSATLYYPLGTHPNHHAPVSTAVHQRDKAAQDAASQMWPAGAYPPGVPLPHARGGQAVAGMPQDSAQHAGVNTSAVPMGASLAELQAAPADAAAATMRLAGTRSATPQHSQQAQHAQQARYPVALAAHPYLQMHGVSAAAAAGGVRIQGHDGAVHDSETLGGRMASMQDYPSQRAQRGGSRPNSALSAPSGVQHIMPPPPAMHADLMHRRSMPGSPTERGMVNGDALQSYAAAAAADNKREGGGIAVYEGFRGRNGPLMAHAQGGRNGGAHNGGRRQSATQLAVGPPPPPPPQPSGRQAFAHDNTHLHLEHKGMPHAHTVHHTQRGAAGDGHADGAAAADGATAPNHQSDAHVVRQAGPYGGAIFVQPQPQHRGSSSHTEVPAGLQQITAIGLPTTTAPGAAYSMGTPIILASGQSLHMPHAVAQQHVPHSAGIGLQSGGGQVGGAGTARSPGLLQMDPAQPVPIQLGEHHRGLFPTSVDPIYAHIIRTVQPPFNAGENVSGQRGSDHGATASAAGSRRRAATEPNTPTGPHSNGVPERRTGAVPQARPSSRPLSQRASNATLGGAAPDTLRHSNHGSRVWGHPQSEQGMSSTAEFASAAAWSTGPGSPHGDTSSGLFMDARQDSLASSQDDLTQHSGSLYTAASTLSQFVQAVSVSGSGGAPQSDLANTPRSAAGPGPGRDTLLRSVHSLTETTSRQHAQHDSQHGAAERPATPMEIVSGALLKPNAWAAGAPPWERGGEAGPVGHAHIPASSVGMGLPMQPTEAYFHPHPHGGDSYDLTQSQFAGNRGSDVSSRGSYGGRSAQPHHGDRSGHTHHGDSMGRGGYSGADGPGRGRYKSGRGGSKTRSSSAGSYGGGREGGGGRGHRNGGRGPYQHVHERHAQAGPMGSERNAAPRSHVADNADTGRGGAAAAAAAVAAAGAEKPSQADPRLLLDNAQQFPALDGGSVTSPRAAVAASAAAQWPAKDRLAAIPPAAPERTTAASVAGSTTSGGGGASGRLMSDATQAAAAPPVEPPANPPLQRAWSDQPKERFGVGGARSAAEVVGRSLHPYNAGGDAGRPGRHGAPPARKSVSSWSEVAQSPAVAGMPRGARCGSNGGGGGAYTPPAPASDSGPVRQWHMPGGRGGPYGRSGGGGRRGAYNGSNHGYPSAYGSNRVSHTGGPPPRRGRSEEGGPRPSDSRSNASSGR